MVRHLAHLDIKLVAHGSNGFDEPGAAAVGARSAQGAFQRLLHPLAGYGHQAEIVELQNLRRRAVALERFLEGLHDFLAVAALIHINEINDDDAAQIAQANLAHDLFDGVNVGLDDGVFQLLRLADVLAGVDVNGHQRLGLVNDDVAAGFEPDFRLQCLVDLILNAELLEERGFLGIELHALDQRGLKAVDETQNAFVLRLAIHPDVGEAFGNLVAQDALDQIEVVINQSAALAGIGTLADLAPQVQQKTDVGTEIFFAGAGRGGADDEAATVTVG